MRLFLSRFRRYPVFPRHVITKPRYYHRSHHLLKLVETSEYKIYKVESETTVSRVKRRLAALFGMHVNTGEVKPSMALEPPESVRGMKVLDRDTFDQTVYVPTLKVPCPLVAKVTKRMKKKLLKMMKIKQVAELSDDDPDKNEYRLLIFDPEHSRSVEDFSDEDRMFLKENKVDLGSWKSHELQLNYDNWMYGDIFKAILPENCEGVGGFSIIGHIVHLNLKEELLEYKELIGAVLLDKVSTAETVINKLGTIDNTFRNFQLELLAGKEDYIVHVKEHGLAFQFDFSKVYWNPRLATEHNRIVNMLRAGDVVYDMFAGVGPFAAPAAKKRCAVYANDLNPESYKWLEKNLETNTKGKAGPKPRAFNLDGREFARTVIKPDLLDRWRTIAEPFYSIHIVMNLPALAVEFLDVFSGLLRDSVAEGSTFENVIIPRVHCYGFSKSDDPVSDMRQRTEAALGVTLGADHTIRNVRNVAPNKEMMCVSFDLDEHLLLGKQSSATSCTDSAADQSGQEPPEKRSKNES